MQLIGKADEATWNKEVFTKLIQTCNGIQKLEDAEPRHAWIEEETNNKVRVAY